MNTPQFIDSIYSWQTCTVFPIPGYLRGAVLWAFLGQSFGARGNTFLSGMERGVSSVSLHRHCQAPFPRAVLICIPTSQVSEFLISTNIVFCWCRSFSLSPFWWLVGFLTVGTSGQPCAHFSAGLFIFDLLTCRRTFSIRFRNFCYFKMRCHLLMGALPLYSLNDIYCDQSFSWAVVRFVSQ